MGEEIQAAMERLSSKGWTLQAMSETLGVSRYTVSRWWYGETRPEPAVPVLFALRAMEGLPVPDWPKPRAHRLPLLTAVPAYV